MKIPRQLVAVGFATTLIFFALPALAETEAFRPRLSISIPTFSFSEITRAGGTVTIPWLAEYANGAYKFAIGAAGLLAVVMMMYGGVRWLTAGGDSGRVTIAKDHIKNAAVGLVIVLGAYVILLTVSPDLVSFKPITITTVERKQLEMVSSSQITALTGSAPLTRTQMLKQATDQAKAMAGDDFACFVRASMEKESGGRQNVIGHDENATSTAFSVNARRQFQASGVKYSKENFEPVICRDASCQNKGPLNDDAINLSAPPDYGLDWRYSHGIGAGQSTIFPASLPCPGREAEGRGFRTGGKCYTLPDLLDSGKQIEAMLDHYKYCWGKTNNGTDPAAGYICYGGASLKPNNPIVVARIDGYNKCREENKKLSQ
jgi:hypothetical protein